MTLTELKITLTGIAREGVGYLSSHNLPFEYIFVLLQPWTTVTGRVQKNTGPSTEHYDFTVAIQQSILMDLLPDLKKALKNKAYAADFLSLLRQYSDSRSLWQWITALTLPRSEHHGHLKACPLATGNTTTVLAERLSVMTTQDRPVELKDLAYDILPGFGVLAFGAAISWLTPCVTPFVTAAALMNVWGKPIASLSEVDLMSGKHHQHDSLLQVMFPYMGQRQRNNLLKLWQEDAQGWSLPQAAIAVATERATSPDMTLNEAFARVHQTRHKITPKHAAPGFPDMLLAFCQLIYGSNRPEENAQSLLNNIGWSGAGGSSLSSVKAPHGLAPAPGTLPAQPMTPANYALAQVADLNGRETYRNELLKTINDISFTHNNRFDREKLKLTLAKFRPPTSPLRESEITEVRRRIENLKEVTKARSNPAEALKRDRDALFDSLSQAKGSVPELSSVALPVKLQGCAVALPGPVRTQLSKDFPAAYKQMELSGHLTSLNALSSSWPLPGAAAMPVVAGASNSSVVTGLNSQENLEAKVITAGDVSDLDVVWYHLQEMMALDSEELQHWQSSVLTVLREDSPYYADVKKRLAELETLHKLIYRVSRLNEDTTTKRAILSELNGLTWKRRSRLRLQCQNERYILQGRVYNETTKHFLWHTFSDEFINHATWANLITPGLIEFSGVALDITEPEYVSVASVLKVYGYELNNSPTCDEIKALAEQVLSDTGREAAGTNPLLNGDYRRIMVALHYLLIQSRRKKVNVASISYLPAANSPLRVETLRNANLLTDILKILHWPEDYEGFTTKTAAFDRFVKSVSKWHQNIDWQKPVMLSYDYNDILLCTAWRNRKNVDGTPGELVYGSRNIPKKLYRNLRWTFGEVLPDLNIPYQKKIRIRNDGAIDLIGAMQRYNLSMTASPEKAEIEEVIAQLKRSQSQFMLPDVDSKRLQGDENQLNLEEQFVTPEVTSAAEAYPGDRDPQPVHRLDSASSQEAFNRTNTIRNNAIHVLISDLIIKKDEIAIPLGSMDVTEIKRALELNDAGERDDDKPFTTLLSELLIGNERNHSELVIDEVINSTRWQKFSDRVNQNADHLVTGMDKIQTSVMAIMTLLLHRAEQSFMHISLTPESSRKHEYDTLTSLLDIVNSLGNYIRDQGYNLCAIDNFAAKLINGAQSALNLTPYVTTHVEPQPPETNVNALIATLGAAKKQLQAGGKVNLSNIFVPLAEGSKEYQEFLLPLNQLSKLNDLSTIKNGTSNVADLLANDLKNKVQDRVKKGYHLILNANHNGGDLVFERANLSGEVISHKAYNSHNRNHLGHNLSPLRRNNDLCVRLRDDKSISAFSLLKIHGYSVPSLANAAEIQKIIDEIDLRQPVSYTSISAPLKPASATMKINISEPLISFNLSKTIAGGGGYNEIEKIVLALGQQVCAHYTDLLMKTPARFGISRLDNERALIASLQSMGGFSITGSIRDVHGVHDLYKIHQTATSEKSESLELYIKTAMQSAYRAIRHYIEFENNEGRISISGLDMHLDAPNFIPVMPLMTQDLIHDLGIVDEDSGLLLDPLSLQAETQIHNFFSRLEMEITNSQPTGLLKQAVLRRLKRTGIDADTLSENELYPHVERITRDLLTTVYEHQAQNIEVQQTMLVRLQPGITELVARQLCIMLGLEEKYWVVLATSKIEISSPANWHLAPLILGEGLVEKRTYKKTLLEIVYDERMRSKYAHTDAENVITQISGHILRATQYQGNIHTLSRKVRTMFVNRGVPPFGMLDNNELPASIREPRVWFDNKNRQYINDAVSEFKKLESQRLILTSSNAAYRIPLISMESHNDAAFDQLTPVEKQNLQKALTRFRRYLEINQSRYDVADLSTDQELIIQSVRSTLGQMPVISGLVEFICSVIETNREGMQIAGLELLSQLMVLGGARSVALMGKMLGSGVETYEYVQLIEGIKAAVNARDGVETMKLLGYLITGGFNTLKSSINISRQALDSVTSIARGAKEISQNPASYAIQLAEVIKTADRWHIRESGIIVNNAWRRSIVSTDYHGNVYLSDNSRAIACPDSVETIYMHQGEPWIRAGGELRLLRAQGLAVNQWKASSPGGTEFSRYPDRTKLPGVKESSSDARQVVSWFDNRTLIPRSIITPGEKQHNKELLLGVTEHKYVTNDNGILRPLEHRGIDGELTHLIASDGTSYYITGKLSPTPRYKDKTEAKITVLKGKFAVVELANIVEGVSDIRYVSGVLMKTRSGAKELVLEADIGVHYRGTLDDNEKTLQVERISPMADPKRASPTRHNQEVSYRADLSRDDFALELYYSSKAANEAYSKDHEWVATKLATLSLIKNTLPSEITNIRNPWYIFEDEASSQSETGMLTEHAILFAPRLSNILPTWLLSRSVTWGQTARDGDISCAEYVLQRLTDENNEPLLDTGEALGAPGAELDDQSRQILLQKLGGNNLLIVRVTPVTGEIRYFIELMDKEPAGTLRPLSPEITCIQERLVMSVESAFTRPELVKEIVLVSLNVIPDALVADLFTSTRRGYPWKSVTSLEDPHALRVPSSGVYEVSVLSDATTRLMTDIKAVAIGTDGFVPYSTGPKRGAYHRNGLDYVMLDNGMLYRAEWKGNGDYFQLLPHDGRKNGPVVRTKRDSYGEFVLISPDGWRQSTVDLNFNPTPTTLEVAHVAGNEYVIVADPLQVLLYGLNEQEQPILLIEGVPYARFESSDSEISYRRQGPADNRVLIPCRRSRALELLVGCGVSMASEGMETRETPAKGTDEPENNGFMLWFSDVHSSATQKKTKDDNTFEVVPYGGNYITAIDGMEKYKKINARRRKDLELPERPDYLSKISASVEWRVGCGIRLNIPRIESFLENSAVKLSASIFRRKEADNRKSEFEDIIMNYDGAWFTHSISRADGEPTPVSFELKKMTSDNLSDRERELKRLHTGMQNANYQARKKGMPEMENILLSVEQAMVIPVELEQSEFYHTETTAAQAYLFDRTVRKNTQLAFREKAGWVWSKIDEIDQSNPDFKAAVDDNVKIIQMLFPKRDINTVADVIDISNDMKADIIKARNFLFLWLNDHEVIMALSGPAPYNYAETPELFRKDGSNEVLLYKEVVIGEKSVKIHFANQHPDIESLIEDMQSNQYPHAIPRAATIKQLEESVEVSRMDFTHERDSEVYAVALARKMDRDRIESDELGRDTVRDGTLVIVNRNDACLSCSALLQTYGRNFREVIHLFLRNYPKY